MTSSWSSFYILEGFLVNKSTLWLGRDVCKDLSSRHLDWSGYRHTEGKKFIMWEDGFKSCTCKGRHSSVFRLWAAEVRAQQPPSSKDPVDGLIASKPDFISAICSMAHGTLYSFSMEGRQNLTNIWTMLERA